MTKANLRNHYIHLIFSETLRSMIVGTKMIANNLPWLQVLINNAYKDKKCQLGFNAKILSLTHSRINVD